MSGMRGMERCEAPRVPFLLQEGRRTGFRGAAVDLACVRGSAGAVRVPVAQPLRREPALGEAGFFYPLDLFEMYVIMYMYEPRNNTAHYRGAKNNF
mgnify:FL=1